MQDFSRRDFLKTTAAAGLGAAAGIGFPSVLRAQGGGTVKVGVLHSLSGTMAISEVSLRDVCMMAFEEINAKGGVMGKKIEPVVVDPASNWDLFAEKAKQLLLQDKVAVTFGCWTSVSRKSVLPVFENNDGPALLPRAVRGRGVLEGRLLHGRHAEPAADPGGRVPDVEGGRRVQEVLPARHRLRLPAHGQQDPSRVPAREGRAGGQHRRGVHAVQPSGLPDHRRQDQALRLRRRRLRALDDQRRQQRALLQGVRQPGPALRDGADHGLQRGRGRAARHGHLRAGRPPRGVELLPVGRHAAEQEVHPGLQELRREEQAARRLQARHRRPDGGGLLRRLHLEAGRREGQVVRRGRGPQGRLRPDVPGAGRRRSRWTRPTTTPTSRC